MTVQPDPALVVPEDADPRHPYADQPDRAFWKHAVTGHDAASLTELAPPIPDLDTARVATAGSCFAQHIGRALRDRGARYMDLEPAPPALWPANADRLGYGVYSCRYGNIYTTRQLVQLFDEAHDTRRPAEPIWRRDGRFYDALRPGLQPNGFGSIREVEVLRRAHLEKVRKMFKRLDIFVFTLGLTETWVSRIDGTAYPSAPGVIAGSYDPERHVFVNLGYPEVLADLIAFRDRLKTVNPDARILLTVSPVPLAATATDQHVLVATTQSKAVLRAAAGQMAAEHDDVAYFPSYEIITGQPARHGFYGPDLRSVQPEGVETVMGHLFPTPAPKPAPAKTAEQVDDTLGYEHCEEGLLADVARNDPGAGR